MTFFGKTSSDLAKEKYVPVSHYHDMRNITFGLNTSEVFRHDPKHIGFNASKHNFVANILDGFENVLDIGCMDGFGTAIVASFAKHVTAIDFYEEHIAEAKKCFGDDLKNVEFRGADFLDEPEDNAYDGCFALDVLEHIDPAQEPIFLKNVVRTLKENGVCIIGMPSLESQVYASEANRFSHINCQTSEQLAGTLKKYFHNVFSFGFNDEVLHTGYGRMCQYLMKVCVGPRKEMVR